MTEMSGLTTDNRVDTQLVYAHGIAALITLLIAITFGILVSLQFIAPDITGDSLTFGWGRLRYAHTQGIMMGWLGNAFFAFLYHAVPILTGFKVTSKRLGRWLFAIWNFAVMLPGWVLLLAGISQPLEWAEFPLVIDFFIVIGFALAIVQFLPPFFKHSLEKLYVSSWYIIGSLVFTFLAFPMGNIAPEVVPGAAGAAISGLWIHDSVGLFVTPLALAIIYFVIPASTGRPIFSHFLSMLGFWGLFFFYPLNGTHHYIFSVIPMEAQLGAIAASALLGVVVVIVVTNLLLSLRGAGIFPKDVGLRFVAMSVIFYIIVSLQGASQAQMVFNQTIHFTDWVIGHSHLAMLGFATFAGIGGIIHAWQRIPSARYNQKALHWSYWLLLGGISVMVIDLTIVGVLQGQIWQNEVPWIESIRISQPYWMIRSLTAIPIAAGFILLLVGFTTGPRIADQPFVKNSAIDSPVAEVEPLMVAETSGIRKYGAGLTMSYIVASVAGIAFFLLSVALLGIWPARTLSQQTVAMAPENPLPLTDSEERGRKIYAREGCSYCHTQQIRYVASDMDRFGAPTLAWESRFDYPHLMGTRRIGADLSRAGNVRTDNWHYVHLFAPRAVVPQSIMPSYAALFERTPNHPKQEARDLVAYIQSLGRPRELAWPEGDLIAREKAEDDKWALMSLDAPLLNTHPARARQTQEALLLPAATPSERGITLWIENCAGCHGAAGEGDGPAAKWLEPMPANLAERDFTLEKLSNVLWNGVYNTAMPAWRDHSQENRSLLAATVRSFSVQRPEEKVAPETLLLGASIYDKHCSECHGNNGDGNGFAAKQFPVMPSNFRGERPSFEESIKILKNGVKGTSMAPWTDRLTEEEIVAVSHYVRQFFGNDNIGGAIR